MFKILTFMILLVVQSYAGGVSLENLSSSQLESTYQSGGLDAVVRDFYKVSVFLASQFSKLEKNSKGLRVVSNLHKDQLDRMVAIAQEITDRYDRSNMHYYGFSKLYKVVPLDLSLAIERSNLSAEQKVHMRQTLKNNL